jgi:hypothetical protein
MYLFLITDIQDGVSMPLAIQETVSLPCFRPSCHKRDHSHLIGIANLLLLSNSPERMEYWLVDRRVNSVKGGNDAGLIEKLTL